MEQCLRVYSAARVVIVGTRSNIQNAMGINKIVAQSDHATSIHNSYAHQPMNTNQIARSGSGC